MCQTYLNVPVLPKTPIWKVGRDTLFLKSLLLRSRPLNTRMSWHYLIRQTPLGPEGRRKKIGQLKERDRKRLRAMSKI